MSPQIKSDIYIFPGVEIALYVVYTQKSASPGVEMFLDPPLLYIAKHIRLITRTEGLSENNQIYI